MDTQVQSHRVKGTDVTSQNAVTKSAPPFMRSEFPFDLNKIGEINKRRTRGLIFGVATVTTGVSVYALLSQPNCVGHISPDASKTTKLHFPTVTMLQGKDNIASTVTNKIEYGYDDHSIW